MLCLCARFLDIAMPYLGIATIPGEHVKHAGKTQIMYILVILCLQSAVLVTVNYITVFPEMLKTYIFSINLWYCHIPVWLIG